MMLYDTLAYTNTWSSYINPNFEQLWSYRVISGWWFEPLWKMWKSVGITIPICYGKIKFMFQTTHQIWWSNYFPFMSMNIKQNWGPLKSPSPSPLRPWLPPHSSDTTIHAKRNTRRRRPTIFYLLFFAYVIVYTCTHTQSHTHNHTHIYIYICIYIYTNLEMECIILS